MWQSVFLYRERGSDPSFWAEPINAWTNLAFLIAAIAAWGLTRKQNSLTDSSLLLIGLAASVGVGSFIFHTTARELTMWFDLIPIALFQIAAFWLFGTRLLHWHRVATALFIVAIVGTSFAALPLRSVLNGSLFYFPALLALLVIGVLLLRRVECEPSLLLIGAAIFMCALIARTFDRQVPWPQGTHFLWHLLNGGLVYVTLRAWILNEPRQTQTDS